MARKADVAERPSAEMERILSDADLRQINTFEDALAAAQAAYGVITDGAEYIGNGFTLFGDSDKPRLCNTPLLIVQWSENMGDYGPYASVAAVTKAGEKVIFNDGGTGILKQLQEIYELTGRSAGYMFEGGLRVSTYDTCKTCGRPRKPGVDCGNQQCTDVSDLRGKGSTFYFNTATG